MYFERSYQSSQRITVTRQRRHDLRFGVARCAAEAVPFCVNPVVLLSVLFVLFGFFLQLSGPHLAHHAL